MTFPSAIAAAFQRGHKHTAFCLKLYMIWCNHRRIILILIHRSKQHLYALHVYDCHIISYAFLDLHTHLHITHTYIHVYIIYNYWGKNEKKRKEYLKGHEMGEAENMVEPWTGFHESLVHSRRKPHEFC